MKHGEMIINPLFAAPVMKTNLDIGDLERYRSFALIKRAQENRQEKQKEKIVKSNVGGWHSKMLDLKDKTMTMLLNKIGQPIDNFLDYYQLDKDKYTAEYSEAWFIVNEKNNYNVPHIHQNSFLSGVFYLQTYDNTGDIVFHHHAKNIDYHKQPNDAFKNYEPHNSEIWKITPQNGDLIVFPSFLYHSVSENKSEDLRIILSFNINLVKK